MFKIKGQVQASDWGDLDAIAQIIGFEPTGEPQAEYWLGAHHKAPSSLDGSLSGASEEMTLDDAIAANPTEMLGARVAQQFDQLPFLLKILAARKPLSIQAHPSVEQAKAGFMRENAAGVDLLAFNRSYRDTNHKPEMICAITPFEAKCGLRPVAEVADLLSLFESDLVAQWRQVLDAEASKGASGASDGGDAAVLQQAVSWVLTLDPEESNALVGEIVAEARRLVDGASARAGRYFSELTWTVQINEFFPGDIGIAVALLLNHVTLQPGEALFLGAGNLHAYLSGVGVELMANSDNVLRGGLTSKHIDVDELLAVVSYEPMRPVVQRPDSMSHSYDAPIPEFSLSRIVGPGFRPADGPPDQPITIELETDGPEIVLVTDGAIQLSADETNSTTSKTLGPSQIELAGGEAAFVPAAHGGYRITTTAPRTVAWRATSGVGR